MKNMKKQAMKGLELIQGSGYRIDLSLEDIKQLQEIVNEAAINHIGHVLGTDDLVQSAELAKYFSGASMSLALDAITTAYYAGVAVGCRAAQREARKEAMI